MLCGPRWAESLAAEPCLPHHILITCRLPPMLPHKSPIPAAHLSPPLLPLLPICRAPDLKGLDLNSLKGLLPPLPDKLKLPEKVELPEFDPDSLKLPDIKLEVPKFQPPPALKNLQRFELPTWPPSLDFKPPPGPRFKFRTPALPPPAPVPAAPALPLPPPPPAPKSQPAPAAPETAPLAAAVEQEAPAVALPPPPPLPSPPKLPSLRALEAPKFEAPTSSLPEPPSFSQPEQPPAPAPQPLPPPPAPARPALAPQEQPVPRPQPAAKPQAKQAESSKQEQQPQQKKRSGPLPLWLAELLVIGAYVGIGLALTKYADQASRALRWGRRGANPPVFNTRLGKRPGSWGAVFPGWPAPLATADDTCLPLPRSSAALRRVLWERLTRPWRMPCPRSEPVSEAVAARNRNRREAHCRSPQGCMAWLGDPTRLPPVVSPAYLKRCALPGQVSGTAAWQLWLRRGCWRVSLFPLPLCHQHDPF